MGLELNYINSQTPIDEDEKEGLLITTISNRGELDEFEQVNIQKAVEWSMKNKFSVERILTQKFITELHKRMFGKVWKWAGEFRNSNKNIGVDQFQISLELKKLIDDTKFWVENKSFANEEVVIRFKHRLVKIHLFPNGNGRHSRLIADIFVSHVFGLPYFTWGSKNLTEISETRKNYITALKDADNNDYKNLIKFARE
jgi:Fic-DOC domain mobile mystery protein B